MIRENMEYWESFIRQILKDYYFNSFTKEAIINALKRKEITIMCNPFIDPFTKFEPKPKYQHDFLIAPSIDAAIDFLSKKYNDSRDIILENYKFCRCKAIS